jgi:Flp pilus assembly protein TadB
VTPVVLASLASLAVLLLARPPGWRPARSARGARRSLPRPGVSTAAVLVALATGALLGGGTGLVVGMGLGVLVRVGVPRLENEADRRRRSLVARQAPLVVDLVSACLSSGAGLEVSLSAAARAVGAPTSEVLLEAVAALRLGAEPAAVWRRVAETEALGSLARAAARSQQTGAPLADLLPRVADQVRAQQRAQVEARIRTAGVRLTAPLGGALLPAFFLLGVVPVVASWVGVLL